MQSMAIQPGLRRDTRAWKTQVWVSFGLAVALCGTGLAYLPGQDIDRGFMMMGYGFCLCAALALAKHVRDAEAGRADPLRGDSAQWAWVAWGGFALAMGLTAWGLTRMDINPAYRAYLGVGWLYLISSAFTLAKTLRDEHECDLAQAFARGAQHGLNAQPGAHSVAAPANLGAQS